MTVLQQVITILAVIIGTMLTRFLPFLLFPEGKTPPRFIAWLGTVLPCAVIGFLVVYGLKDAVFSRFHGIPELLSILFTVFLHRWRRNTLLSVGGGTILYMYLVQTWFH